MPVIFTTLLSLLGGAFGPLTDWIRRKQQLQMAVQEAQQRIELQLLKNEGQVEEAEARSTGDRLNATAAMFKYGTFLMWFYPFIIGQFRPAYAQVVFNNLNAMPSWYTSSCVIIMFAIWGISVASPVVTGVFSQLGSFFQERRDHKERLAAINRPVVFDSLRSQVRGGLSQDFVNKVNIALDAADAADTTRN